MREHPPQIRYTLMACLTHIRTTEVTDYIVRMMLDFDSQGRHITERQLNRELLHDIKRVEGKMQILFRVAEAVLEEPDGTVREVVFPRVKEQTFQHLVTEFKYTRPQYRLIHQFYMRNKHLHHSRRMFAATPGESYLSQRQSFSARDRSACSYQALHWHKAPIFS